MGATLASGSFGIGEITINVKYFFFLIVTDDEWDTGPGASDNCVTKTAEEIGSLMFEFFLR